MSTVTKEFGGGGGHTLGRIGAFARGYRYRVASAAAWCDRFPVIFIERDHRGASTLREAGNVEQLHEPISQPTMALQTMTSDHEQLSI